METNNSEQGIASRTLLIPKKIGKRRINSLFMRSNCCEVGSQKAEVDQCVLRLQINLEKEANHGSVCPRKPNTTVKMDTPAGTIQQKIFPQMLKYPLEPALLATKDDHAIIKTLSAP